MASARSCSTSPKAALAATCLAHARRKFHEPWANHRSTLAEQALRYSQGCMTLSARWPSCQLTLSQEMTLSQET
jgi:hypothetical protein